MTYDYNVYPINATQLRVELNASVDLTITCISIEYIDEMTTEPNVRLIWNDTPTMEDNAIIQNILDSHIVRPATISVADLPLSTLGNKLGVHSSAKPAVPGKEFYLVWTGSGDDIDNGIIGEGDLLQFDLAVGIPSVTRDIQFGPQFGDTYIHEGYANWSGGGSGDYLTALIIASATQMQTAANLDYIIEDDWVKPAPGGEGTGTHGFAGQPVLIARTFAHDGEFAYDATNGLTVNSANTGMYRISTVERVVHKYINRIPTSGNSYGFTTLTSDETAYLPPGYLIRIEAVNNSNTDWNATVFFEVFRERTAVP